MRTRKWKSVVKDLIDTHEEHGDSVVSVGILSTGDIEGCWIVNTCKDVLRVRGSLDRKQIQRWLWNHRTSRAFKRLGGLLWSSTENGEAVIGYGSFTSPEVARRFERMVVNG
jgi:hypothetical protein